MVVPADYNEADYEIPIFTSMGMFIIDEIHFLDKTSQYNVFGGGGSYCIMGSRMVLPKSQSKRAAWIVDIGHDMPSSIFDELKLWDTGIILRYDNSRFCTRGSVTYTENERQHFKYMTEKKRIDIDDVINYPHLLKSKSYHFICSAERCDQLTLQLDTLRSNDNLEPPVIAWEPFPADCKPEKLQACIDTLSKVDILTPNAAEAAAYFNEDEPLTHEGCELLAKRFLKYMTKNNKSGVILRCGKLGCYTVDCNMKVSKWYPAYHNIKYSDFKVIDPTGGGNTFVGGFLSGFILSNKNWDIGSICGNISAGCAIEQHGMPKLTIHESKSGDLIERWNGLSFLERLERYLERNPELNISRQEFLKLIYPSN